MSVILLSIHARHADAIFAGHKTVELRRGLPADTHVSRAVLYVTAPIKLIVGEVAIVGRFDSPIDEAWCSIGSEAAVSRDEFKRYFAGRRATGLLLGRSIRYAEPIDPRIGGQDAAWAKHGLKAPEPDWRAPQSWRYWPVIA